LNVFGADAPVRVESFEGSRGGKHYRITESPFGQILFIPLDSMPRGQRFLVAAEHPPVAGFEHPMEESFARYLAQRNVRPWKVVRAGRKGFANVLRSLAEPSAPSAGDASIGEEGAGPPFAVPLEAEAELLGLARNRVADKCAGIVRAGLRGDPVPWLTAVAPGMGLRTAACAVAQRLGLDAMEAGLARALAVDRMFATKAETLWSGILACRAETGEDALLVLNDAELLLTLPDGQRHYVIAELSRMNVLLLGRRIAGMPARIPNVATFALPGLTHAEFLEFMKTEYPDLALVGSAAKDLFRAASVAGAALPGRLHFLVNVGMALVDPAQDIRFEQQRFPDDIAGALSVARLAWEE
jgi:hypothetical protein